MGAERAQAIVAELERAALAIDDLVAPPDRLVAGSPAAGHRAGVDGALERVDLVGLARDSVEAWSALAAARGVRLRLVPVLGEVPEVAGHRVRLAQALGNLIANAIEHGGGE